MFQWDDKNYKKNLRKVKIKATHMVILWDEETNRLDLSIFSQRFKFLIMIYIKNSKVPSLLKIKKRN